MEDAASLLGKQLQTFILDAELPQEQLDAILQSALCSDGAADTTALRNAVLTARGLFAGDVLRASLHKRHRVEFGVDNNTHRCKMAIPFRYKDAPSERTEFGHPDMAIALTLRAYYEHGLNRSRFRELIRHVEELPAVQQEELYHDWLRAAVQEVDTRPSAGETLEEAVAKRLGLPKASSGLVSDDARMVELLWKQLASNMRVVETYLEEIVFPEETRQFPHKAFRDTGSRVGSCGVRIQLPYRCPPVAGTWLPGDCEGSRELQTTGRCCRWGFASTNLRVCGTRMDMRSDVYLILVWQGPRQ